MDSHMNGLLGRAVADVPVAVIDFETTGMWPGPDRVVEVSVVRVEPGRPPELVLDTLVNPARRMGCTFVHGITDRDVADAPRFELVAGRVLEALAGCVVAAYNVSFDIRFLEHELARAGTPHPFPHLCLMYLRPLLGLGKHCRLARACQSHGITLAGAHTAAGDARAAAHLWTVYRETMGQLGLETFADVAARKPYKFTQSFTREPHPAVQRAGTAIALKARTSSSRPTHPAPLPLDRIARKS
jgi:DNA polymerase-3 subunit epsilon